MEKTSKVTKAVYDHSWVKDGKNYYDHNIEMENGDKGTYSSIRQDQTNFTVGKEVVYDINPDARGNMKIKFDSKRQPGGNSNSSSAPAQNNNSYKAKTMDPKEQLRIQKQVCYEVAIAALLVIQSKATEETPKIEKNMDYVLSDKLLEWYKAKATNVNNSMCASKALREAVNAINIPSLSTGAQGLSLEIINKAEEIFGYFTKEETVAASPTII